MPILKKTFLAFAILTIILQLSTKVHTAEVPMTVATDITIHTVNNPNSFTVDIPQTEYDHAYIGIVKPEQIYPGPTCTFNPSTFSPISSGGYVLPAAWLTAGDDYRIDSYLTYRFVSKTSTSNVYALGYDEIKTALPANALTGGVQMVIDPAGTGTMYILNNQRGFTYDLTTFVGGVAVTPPSTPIVPFLPASTPFSFTIPTITDARLDATTGRIYVKAGNEIGYITLPFSSATYTSIFQEVTGQGVLKDFAIRGNYVYAVQEEALFVRRIGGTQQKQYDLRRGRFVRTYGSTIIVVADTSSIVYEYFIVDDLSVTDIEQVITFNRHIPIQHGNFMVTDVAIDNHYLYIATKKETLIVRHTIPQAFSLTLKNYAQEVYPPWAGDDVKVILETNTGESKFLLLRDTSLYEYTMALQKPTLYCIADGVAGCKFTSKIESYQRRCPGWMTDPNDFCKLTQNIFINVLESSTACPDTTKNAEGLAVTPGLIYHGSGLVSENGDVRGRTRIPYVRKERPTNFTIQPHYNQTRNEERAKNYTGRHNNIFNQATPVDQASTRIPLPHTGGNAPTPARKEEERPVMNTETVAPESDSEKKGEIIEMINENKELMNGLVISVIALFVILGLFIMFVIWHFANKQKGGADQNESAQEEKSGFVVIPEARKKQKKDLNVSQLHTFVDESRIHADTESYETQG